MFCFTNLLCLKVNGLWNRRASSLPFFPATAISKIPEAYLWGCAHGGCLTVALPATRETANQSKGLLFCKAPDKIFFQMLYLKEASEGNLTFIIGNLSLLGHGFRGEVGSPIGSLCCHVLSSLPTDGSHLLQCPSSPADTAGSAGLLSPDQGTHLDGWRGKKKIVSHPKQKAIAACLPPGSSVLFGVPASQRTTPHGSTTKSL